MANTSSSISSDRDIRYHADIWIEGIRTGKVEAPTGRHSSFIINVNKGRYVLCQRPYFCCERITEAIHSKSFQELPDDDKLVIVIPLNPTAKFFPRIINRHTHSNSSTQLYPTTLRHLELIQRRIWLLWLVVWFHLINQTKKLRHEMRTRNRANRDIRTFSGYLDK